MKITIETIPHSDQRYNTVGDWTGSAGSQLSIKVSGCDDWRMECLVAVHELVEAILCEHANVSANEVDNFDLAWTPHDGLVEPGEDADAPYYGQHLRATALEKRLATYLGIEWSEYEEAIGEAQASWRTDEYEDEEDYHV